MGVTEVALLIALLIGANYVVKGRAAGHLNFFPGDIQGMQFDGVTPIITFSILVQNTSNVTLTLNSVAANLYANGTLIGNISSFTPQIIPGNGQLSLSVSARMLLLGVVNDIIRAFQTGTYSQALSVDGSINADGIPIPISLQYKVG